MSLRLSLLLLPICAYATNESYDAIAKRLAPVGIVDMQGQTKTTAPKNTDAAVPDRSGQEVFNQYCTVCHTSGVANAPKFGCMKDWIPRKAKGMKILLPHALKGYNFMPPQGTCIDCDQGEIEEAIHYMLNHSEKNTSC